jgi:phosphoribosylamine--glycine ligase
VKVLIVGSGAREHALTWKALQSPLTDAVFCAPGNAGTAAIAANVPIAPADADGIRRCVAERGIDLTILGPEAAVAAGVGDAVRSLKQHVFGPDQAAGRLESSKVFAKEILRKAGVRTPDFKVFRDSAEAKAYVRSEGRAFVVKADGLAKGKGTIVPRDANDTLEAIDRLMVARAVGAAADQVLLEEKLEGREVSLLVLTDGQRTLLLPPACDYKRALDHDRGPNTGGMGAYAPPPFFPQDPAAEVCRTVIEPVLRVMAEAGTPYRGCLYAGLMLHGGQVSVLEFNARFGDPEAQVILPLLGDDLVAAMAAAAAGDLAGSRLNWSSGAAVGVVLAAAGYPGSPRTGDRISGLASLPSDVYAFHAGTAATASGYQTAGGRVLTLVARADTLAAARERAYQAVTKIAFDGMLYRRDIALRELPAAVQS